MISDGYPCLLCTSLCRKHRFGHQAVTSVLGLITVWYLRRRIEGTCFSPWWPWRPWKLRQAVHAFASSRGPQATPWWPEPNFASNDRYITRYDGKKMKQVGDWWWFFGCLSNLSSWHCLFSGWLGLGFDTWWLMLGYPWPPGGQTALHRRRGFQLGESLH